MMTMCIRFFATRLTSTHVFFVVVFFFFFFFFFFLANATLFVVSGWSK